jgi:hypothetical protein
LLKSIIFDPRLFAILFRIDSELAETARLQGCPCGGALHVANYPRKPRSPVELGHEHHKRHSFCCGTCRRRTTPPSVRFLDRRMFMFPIVVVVTALAEGRSGRRLTALLSELGVDRRTLGRWRSWWRDAFPATRFWKVARARFSPSVDPPLPHRLVERFTGGMEGVVDLLRFLSPLGRPDHAS